MTKLQPENEPNNRLGLRRLARDSFLNFIRQSFSVFMAVFISILLARGLGKDAKGMFTITLLFSETFIIFLSLGISTASVYFISRREFSPNFVLSQNIAIGIWICLAGIFFGSLLIVLGGDTLFPEIPKQYLFLSLVIIPINLFVILLGSIFQGMQDFHSFNLPGIVNRIAFFFSIILFVWIFKLGLYGAILAYICSALITLISFMLLIRKKNISNVSFYILPEKKYLRKALQYGLQTHISAIFSFLSLRLDNYLLNGIAGSGAVGIYSVSVGLGERMWLPANAISSTVLPKIASLHNEKEKQQVITPLLGRLVFSITFPAAIILAVLAHWIIPLFYGTEFIGSVQPLLLLLPGILFLNLGRILSNDLAGRGRVGINLVISAAGFFINLCANLILIPIMGSSGAALSSSISYFIVTCMLIFFFTQIASVPFYLFFLPQKGDAILFRRGVEIIKTKFWNWFR